jgi:hypothetical protein
MKTWTTSVHCQSGVHCHACKTDAAFRAQLATEWDVPVVCPFGGRPLVVRTPVPTTIPPALRNTPFADLADLVEATGDPAGIDLAEAQRAHVGRAECQPCARAASAARLRVWLVKHREAGL